MADPNSNRRGVRYSFTTEFLPGQDAVVHPGGFGVVDPTRAICQRVDLQEGTHVYCFTRIRNVDGEPLILETSCLSPVHLSQSHPGDGSRPTAAVCCIMGITAYSAEDTYESVILDATNATSSGRGARRLRAFATSTRTRMAAFMSTFSRRPGPKDLVCAHAKSGMSFQPIIIEQSAPPAQAGGADLYAVIPSGVGGRPVFLHLRLIRIRSYRAC